MNLSYEWGEANVQVRLASLSKEIDHLFDLTKIKTHFKIYNTIHEAINSFE